MKEKNYFAVFAKMSEEAKIFTLQRALDVHPDMAKAMLDKFESELKYQETLLSLTQRKAHISELESKLIDQIKTLRLKGKRKQKEGKKERLIRLRYFQEIDRLRKEGASFRKIAQYIQTYHHKQISHVAIRSAYLKIKKQMEQQDGCGNNR